MVLKDKQGHWHAIAFVMKNEKYPPKVDYSTFMKPVGWIEARTGIDFMPELDAAGNETLHQQLEEEVPTAVWPREGPE